MIVNNKHISYKRYSSGELKLMKSDFAKFHDDKIEIIYNGEETFFELLLVLEYFKSQRKNITLFLSYLPYQRMDHDDEINICTQSLVASLINKLEINNIFIGEPHCDISNIKNAKKLPIVEIIFKKLSKIINFNYEKDCLIFCDKGAKEKYGHFAKNIIYFDKIRDKQNGLIINHKLNGTIKKDIKYFLIDDIISTGDTIESVLNLLPDNMHLNILCGHYEKNKYNKKLFNNNKIDTIYSSTSLTKKQNKKLVLFKMEDLIYEFKNNK